jgi:hypothetical protein
MNASDIVKAKQDRTLYQAYYRPTIFPGKTTSTIQICPISSVDGGTTTYESTTSIQYNYVCYPPSISYELSNAVNSGKYICGCNNDEGISIWNTGQVIPTDTGNCKISFLQWKNTNVTPVYSYKVNNYSSISTFSTTTLTGPGPVICPLVDFYQGTNFDNRCNTCNATLYDTTNGNC